MKRKGLRWFAAAALATAMGAAMLTGCQSGGEKTNVPVTESGKNTETTHVVTYYDADGSTVLDTEEVEDGACAKEYTPEKEGYIFAGWFATPQMSHKFDFTTAVTEDTNIFAGFVSYQEDTRSFAIVGSGTSPVLLESNWGAVIGDAQTMVKEDVPDANVYDSIDWIYNGESKASGEEKHVDYYIKGAKITNWEDVYTDQTQFVEKDGIYSLTVGLEEGDEFMFTSLVTAGDTKSVGTEYVRYTNIAKDDTESLSCVSGKEGGNLVAGQTGSYTFTYDPSTQVLKVSVSD